MNASKMADAEWDALSAKKRQVERLLVLSLCLPEAPVCLSKGRGGVTDTAFSARLPTKSLKVFLPHTPPSTSVPN